MATQLPPVPLPPGPRVQRIDDSGRPTQAMVTYETRLKAFLDALKAYVEAQP